MKILYREDIPRWFTLTVGMSGFPCVRIYDDILARLKTFRSDIVEQIRKNLDLDEETFPYQEKPGETFGFGQSLTRIAVANGQTTYQLNLPVVHKLTDEACRECRGKKKAEYGMTCHYCSGSGKESLIEWKGIYALSASTAILMDLLEFEGEEERHETPTEKQILTLGLRVERDQHGGSLYGKFSPYFINRLKSYGENASFRMASQAMLRVHRHMYQSSKEDGRDDYDVYKIKAWQNTPGNLLLDVPGNACGIHPSPYVHDIEDNEGVQFTCHNVDTPMQQMTLLTGLAAMCDLVR